MNETELLNRLRELQTKCFACNGPTDVLKVVSAIDDLIQDRWGKK